MGTTARGLRYPEVTDRVADGATAIANLAADVNAEFDTLGVDTAPRASVNRASVLTVPNSTTTQVPFTAEAYDVGGLWAATTADVVTATRAGLYVVHAQAAWAANATGVRVLYLHHTQVGFVAADSRAPVAVGNTWQGLSTELRLAAGDSVNLRAFQTSGGTLDLVTLYGGVNLQMRWVAP